MTDGHHLAMRADRASARRWLGVAIASLLLAGLLAVALVAGRMPGIAGALGDPLLFRRCLVAHVNLSLVVWFYAFLAALFSTVPSRVPAGPLARISSTVAAGGLLLLLAGVAAPSAEPVLSNYVPVVDHPLFVAGLGVLATAVVMALLAPRLLPATEAVRGFFPVPPAARVGLRAAAVAYLVAAVTFAIAAAVTPRELAAHAYWERVAWGGGHVLQVANVAGMLSAWLILLSRALGEPPVGRQAAAALFGSLVAPLLAAPLLAARGTAAPEYLRGFTLLMQWGIFPVVSVFVVLCARAAWCAPQSARRDARTVAWGASALLTVLGFVLGALVRGADTRIPAHYHASVGAVTVVYMAVAYPLLDAVGLPVPSAWLRRVARWQPALYAAGQTIFAAGFALAGSQGMLRKTYGAEQHVGSFTAAAGLWVMGAGGLVAVAGGVLFLCIVARCWRGRVRRPLAREGEMAWQTSSIR